MRQGKTSIWLPLLTALFTGGCATPTPFLTRSPGGPAHSLPPDQPAYIRLPLVVELPGPQTVGNQVAAAFKEGFQKAIPSLTFPAQGQDYPLWLDPVSMGVSGDKLLTSLLIHYHPLSTPQPSGKKEGPKTTGGSEGVTTVLAQFQSAFEWSSDWYLRLSPLRLPNQALPEAVEQVRRAGEDLLRQGNWKFGEKLRGFSNIKPQAAEMWDVVQEPIYLDKGIWLLIRPERVGVGWMRASPEKKIETVLEIEAHPVVIFGSEPAVQKRPLPPLKPVPPGPLGFHAVSTLQIGFPEINRRLVDSATGIVGRTLKESGDFKAKVTSLKIFSLGGQVGVKAEVEYNPIVNLKDGPSSLTLYLKGTPHYDARKRRFDFPDLDFDLKTGDLLLQTAKWLLKSDMRDQLRKQAKVPLGPKLDEVKKRMDEVFNRPLGPHTELTAKVDSLKVVDAFTDDKGFVAQVSLDGQATLHVTWK